MGGFSKLVAMNSLLKEDIKKILTKSDFSSLNTYRLHCRKSHCIKLRG